MFLLSRGGEVAPACRQAGLASPPSEGKAHKMYTVYVLVNKDNRLYIGLTNNLSRRLREHFNRYNSSTKPYRPFSLLYREEFASRPETRKREKYLKSGVGRKWIKEELIYRGVEK